ncbi:uncharacterized protein DUF4956 [Dyadobacter jejuensis]|uniref:Uncharacterized protein DUF4956 n=1 Tax=Dyadobacter jejuensis TaxID=1082580 RepID=A0A316AM72_9BACT|nr:DUF4956 domain-containing protein [Dyadobacter jejuensis]PWJ57890.1 uncharacterized protein DUF4956 [Dyadobacter jejuensis]
MSLFHLTDALSSFDLLDKISLKFILRMSINFASVFILVRFIYYKNYKRTDLFITFFVFNMVIFMITYLLNKVEMSMGAAFGLFAVFSMLRYRTEGISAKDMTYLFLVIAIGLISAISKGGWDELSFFCAIILVVTHLLEGNWLMKKERGKSIIYENIHLIRPQQREALIQDLRERTGLEVHRVEIEDIDFLKDATKMTIYYYPTQSQAIDEEVHSYKTTVL